MSRYNALKKIFGPTITASYRKLRFRLQNPNYKSLLAPNKQFYNIHKGERCFIIGNGPSLKNIDFSTLENEFVFTVNQLPRNPEFKKLKSNYHIWADEVFFAIDKNKPEALELLEVMRAVKTNDHTPIVFYKFQAFEMTRKFHLVDCFPIYYYVDLYMGAYKKENARRKKLFDFTKILPHFDTVIHYAICLAVYMGFSEIYLLGCDCTGFVNLANAHSNCYDQTGYAYQISENEKKRMAKVAAQRPIRDELMSYVHLLDGYEMLNAYCETRNVALYNATEGGVLESVRRVKLADVLSKDKPKHND